MKSLIIIPAFNEAKNIEGVISRLLKEVPEENYIIISDGSQDDLVEVCKKNKYNYLSLSVNLGVGGAVQTGYKYAYDQGYDIAVQHDGDGQHDPAYIEDVIRPIKNGEADIVIGSRFIEKRGFQSSFFRRLGIAFLSFLIKSCFGIKLRDVTSGFRAVNRKYMKFYSDNYPCDYPEPEAIAMAAVNGANITEVPVVMLDRQSGKSSINFGKSIYYMIKVSIAIIVCRITNWRK